MNPAARRSLRLVTIAALLCLLTLALPKHALGAVPTTFTVNSATDQIDSVCDVTTDGCTLGDAISASNANPAHNTIRFDSTIFPPNGSGEPIRIQDTPLPEVNARYGITIDGSDAGVVITQDAGFPTVTDGLVISSPPGVAAHDVTMKDLTIDSFALDGLRICAGKSGGNCPNDLSAVSLENLKLTNNQKEALNIRGANVDGLTITSSTFDHNGMAADPGAGHSIQVYAVNDVTNTSLSGLTLTRNLGGGIVIFASGAASNVSVTDTTLDGSADTGIGIYGYTPESNITVQGNHLSDIGGAAIAVNSGDVLNGVLIKANGVIEATIGVLVGALHSVSQAHIEGNDVSDSAHEGLEFFGQDGDGNWAKGNSLYNNGGGYPGISVERSVDGPPFPRLLISRNSIYGNSGIGIDLSAGPGPDGVTPNDAGDADQGANGLLNFPVINASSPQAISGTACSHCTVELFLSDNDPSGYGEGQLFLADANADGSGNFSIAICTLNLVVGTKLTATATDQSGETSEFSANFTLTTPSGACPTPSPTPSATPTPTPTAGPNQHKQGDLNCDGSVNGKDALYPMRYSSGAPFPTSPGSCPQPTDGDPDFYDVTCDGGIGSPDTLAILEYAAGVPVSPAQPGGCTPLGQTLSG